MTCGLLQLIDSGRFAFIVLDEAAFTDHRLFIVVSDGACGHA